MPKEHRKRGRKHKKASEAEVQPQYHEEPVSAGPSWIKSSEPEVNPEAPFGYVDTDVKAYFRTVDVQIREWAEIGINNEEGDEDLDPNEQRRVFFTAALEEMGGKEKQLATDPDCSPILERMAYSMDDFVRRVFLDALSGSYEQLICHRFSSHVCQTHFTLAADTVGRESRGVYPSIPGTQSENGELRTMIQLVLDVCEEIKPSFSSLIADQFGSHVVRALVVLLCPSITHATSDTSQNLRSKKSAAWKTKQGPMKSVFINEVSNSEVKRKEKYKAPVTFTEMVKGFVMILRQELGPNEVRALAANKVASPVLQLLLEVEAEHGMANDPDSLMDRILAGLISATRQNSDQLPEPSDYVATLLRDPTSSHLLETLVSRCPRRTFDSLIKLYFTGHMGRLAIHPVANFVVAKVIARAEGDVLSDALLEIFPKMDKLLSTGRIGVIKAMVDRAKSRQVYEDKVISAIYNALRLRQDQQEDTALFVPCVLTLLPREEYLSASNSGLASLKNEAGEDLRSKGKSKASDPLQPKVQGSLLLQSILRMNEPHNYTVTNSLLAMPLTDLIALCQNATSSRVIDSVFESPTVSRTAKRKVTMAFLGTYHLLVDDRVGSRVGDRLWASSDPYLKEKIGRSLLSHESDLLASHFGSFFARKLNLHLLRRNPEEWKTQQSRAAASTKEKPVAPVMPIPQSPETSTLVNEARKRKVEDDIEAVFNYAGLAKKKKRGALAGDSHMDVAPVNAKLAVEDEALDQVLGAIKQAPKANHLTQNKKKKVKT